MKLNLLNLNNRPYVHGTSIIKGVLSTIVGQYPTISDFNISLNKKLMTAPVLDISTSEIVSPDAAVIGSFKSPTQMYFQLLPSSDPVTSIYVVDEEAITGRIFETSDEWCLELLFGDDMHVCYNQVSKISNKILFAEQPNIVISPDKQTWFVNCEFPSIEFLKNKQGTIGVSKSYTMLSPRRMKRSLSFNGKFVGYRTCVYA